MSTSFPSVPILDHGYIRLIESWGSDERIIEAARMSTNKGFQGWGNTVKSCPNCLYTSSDDSAHAIVENLCPNCLTPVYIDKSKSTTGDEKLLSYLYSHKHATPFEMAGLIIEVQAPIFVFREWHRHRTQSYNEMSARYTPLPDLNYLPTVERLLQTSSSNKQAQGTSTAVLGLHGAEYIINGLAQSYKETQALYEYCLEHGVPKELARLCLPVARYSRMRASANLRNWLAFLTLRMDQNAQWEIRQYANQVGNLISELFPRTWALFIGDLEKWTFKRSVTFLPSMALILSQ